MKYHTQFFLLIFLLVPAIVTANESKFFDTIGGGCGYDCYRSITFLSQGKTVWTSPKESLADIETGKAFRVVVTTSEIYNEVTIEEISIGSEGCCKKISSSRVLDLEKIYRSFGFVGEIAGFEFSKWVSPNAFEFYIHKRKFLLTDLGKKQIKITEKIS